MGRDTTRREILRTTGGVIAGVTVGRALLPTAVGVGTAQRSAESWHQFGYDDANTGHAPENTGPTDDVDEQWSVETGREVRSSPVVEDDTVYLSSRDGTVYALAASDGTTRWTFETGGGPPVATDETVYVGCWDDSVYALAATDGSERWAADLDDYVSSSPVVANDAVYVASVAGTVTALAASDGTERWRYATGASKQGGLSPAVADATLYVPVYGDRLYALDATAGTERWSVGPEGGVHSSPAVATGTVYVGSATGVHALNAADGTERWSVAVENRNGVTFEVNSSPAVADDTVYVGSGLGVVYALDAADGTVQWRFTADGNVTGAPAVVDGVVYVGSDDGNVYALAASDGSQMWAHETDGRVASSPAVANGSVYVGSDDRHLYALSGSGDTPTPTEATAPASPSASVSTRTGTPTATPQPSTTGQLTGGPGNGQDGGDLPHLALGAGVVGLGGLGALWWRRRGGADEDGATASTPRGGAPAPAGEGGATGPATAPDGRTDPTGADEDASTHDDGRPGTGVRRVPETIPRAPDVSVDYGALSRTEPIGSGGNADVTKATLSTPDGDVILAIKEPRMNGTLHTDAVERLLAEAETWDKLDDHDHVVGVVDYGADPLPWIAMEYMDAGHLGDRAGELGLRHALWTAISVTKGVRHAHRRGVAHLDLKPENVLFRSVEDAWDVPKVADWGLSRHLLEGSQSIEGLSPRYAAPEQFDEAYGPTDDLTDVYQLGALCYELVTGRPPFEGQPTAVMRAVLEDRPVPPSEVADVPERLDVILSTALAKRKDERYDNVAYLRDDLRDLYDGL